MDHRIRLPKGSCLYCQGRVYIIEDYVSAGANSIVYQACYADTLMPEHVHTVLIKELYPLDPLERITRSPSMELQIPPEAMDFFQYNKDSFLLGNQAHLELSADGNGHIAHNLDSFSWNNTLYTVLTARKGEVLSKMLEQGMHFPTLTAVVQCTQNILQALLPFHSHELLHLDISPDNIFMLAPETDGDFPTDVLLLDFNSVYSLKKSDGESPYYFGKTRYRAPEVTLHRREELGPWTDIYSVCTVFYELLTGTQLPGDRELFKASDLINAYGGLLLHEKERSAMLVSRILDRGLAILPEDRYSNVQAMLTDVRELLDTLNGRPHITAEAAAAYMKMESANQPLRVTNRPKRSANLAKCSADSQTRSGNKAVLKRYVKKYVTLLLLLALFLAAVSLLGKRLPIGSKKSCGRSKIMKAGGEKNEGC